MVKGAMVALKLRVPSSEIAHFKRLLSLPREDLARIVSRLTTISPLPSSGALRELLKEEAVNDDDIEALVAITSSLCSLIVAKETTPEKVLLAIFEDLDRQELEWWSREAWQARLETLQLLLSSDSAFGILAKAGSVNSEGVGHTVSIRIITDTRWLFSDDADRIVGALTRHCLSIIHMDTAGNDAVAVFVLDDGDLRKLGDQVQRALAKAATIESLTAAAQKPTFTP